MDRKTDEMMQRLIREEFKHHTVIMIAHRLESLLDFDKIAVMNNGRLVEFDTPGSLLSKPSEFRVLYDAMRSRQS